jgi:hypothetical protein
MKTPGDTSGNQPPSYEGWSRPVTPVEVLETLHGDLGGWEIGGRSIYIGLRATGKDSFSKDVGPGHLLLYVPALDSPARPVLVERAWEDEPGQALPRDVVHPTLSSLMILTRSGLRGTSEMTTRITTKEGRASRRPMMEDLIAAFCSYPIDPTQGREALDRFSAMFKEYLTAVELDRAITGDVLDDTIAAFIQRAENMFSSFGVLLAQRTDISAKLESTDTTE